MVQIAFFRDTCHNNLIEIRAEHVLETALNLLPSKRAQIAASLLQSLDQTFEPELESAWADEIGRRIQEIDEGRVTLIPWDQVMRSTRDRIDGCPPLTKKPPHRSAIGFHGRGSGPV
jgi:putative addiction module component (TIGR02574 family)